MEKYLKREKELLELTNSDFYNLQKVVTNWFSIKNEQITAHNKLVNAMAVHPDFIILSRFETDQPKRRITVYFDHNIEVVPFIPFGGWKLFDNTIQHDRHKYFTLEDTQGEIRTVALTEYIPYLPSYLNEYTQFPSFKEYDNNTKKS